MDSLKAAFGGYVPLVVLARKRITKQHEEEDVGTLAVFYKTAGELCCLAQDYAQGEELLCEALRLLRKVRARARVRVRVRHLAPPLPLRLPLPCHPYPTTLTPTPRCPTSTAAR